MLSSCYDEGKIRTTIGSVLSSGCDESKLRTDLASLLSSIYDESKIRTVLGPVLSSGYDEQGTTFIPTKINSFFQSKVLERTHVKQILQTNRICIVLK